MADTIYRNRWNPIPQIRHPHSQIQPRSAKPKIVNIPVHFIGSDDAVEKKPPEKSTFSKMAAAVEIQRAVRGFLVRKNVRAIRKVLVEVDEIERKLKEEGFKIRLDPRERVRVSEELMALLFRLDSVRGVRGFRKKAIGRVIKLQEEIDSIFDAQDRDIAVIDVADRECLAGERSEEVPVVNDQSLDVQEMEEGKSEFEIEMEFDEISKEESRSGADESLSFDNEKTRDQFVDLEVDLEKIETRLEKGNPTPTTIEPPKRKSDMIEIANCENRTSPTCKEISKDDEERADLIMEVDEISKEDSRCGTDESSSFDSEKIKDQFLDLEIELENIETRSEKGNPNPTAKSNMIEIANCENQTSPTCKEISKDDEERALMAEPLEEKKWLREMMKKMEVENDNLKSMVAQLCENSAEQCRLMAGLSDRVDHLERLSRRNDRRKKRKSCNASSAIK